MDKNKIRAFIKAITLSIISVLAFTGLSHYIPFFEMISDNAALISDFVVFTISVFFWRPYTVEQQAGAILSKRVKKSKLLLNTDHEDELYHRASKG